MSDSRHKSTFEATPSKDFITHITMPLLAMREEDELYASGSAVVIAPHLAITAAHVITDYIRKYDRQVLNTPEDVTRTRKFNSTFDILAPLRVSEDRSIVFTVDKVWTAPHTDVAFLLLSTYDTFPDGYRWQHPIIDLLPPEQGSRVCGFGYRSSEFKVHATGNNLNFDWSDIPTTACSEVVEIHHQMRDRGFMNFPCFRINARFDHGMSGGPIFNDKGMLCGVISSSSFAPEEGGDYCSYGATLWTSMATMVELDMKGSYGTEIYPALELARQGFIQAENWERVELEVGPNNTFSKLGIRMTEQIVDVTCPLCGNVVRENAKTAFSAGSVICPKCDTELLLQPPTSR